MSLLEGMVFIAKRPRCPGQILGAKASLLNRPSHRLTTSPEMNEYGYYVFFFRIVRLSGGNYACQCTAKRAGLCLQWDPAAFNGCTRKYDSANDCWLMELFSFNGACYRVLCLG